MPIAAVRNLLILAVAFGITVAVASGSSAGTSFHVTMARAVLETSAALIGTLVAVLEFHRFRNSGSTADLEILGAVALLAWVHVLFDWLPDVMISDASRSQLTENVETWGTIGVRTAAAILLVVAGLSHSSNTGRSRTPSLRRIINRVLVVVFAALVAVTVLGWRLPANTTGLLNGIEWPGGLSSLLLLLDGVFFVVASFLLARNANADADSFLNWISAGCVLGGLSMVDYALFSSGGANSLRPGDLLRAATIATWAVGAAFEIRSYWTKIAELTRKETRLNVAVELHDGLAQELALLATSTHLPADELTLPEWQQRLQVIADRALSEARRAIAALANDEPVLFKLDLERTAESMSGADIDVHVEVSPSADYAVSDPILRESLIRIVREAVTNAVRHGGASHIDITFDAGSSPLLRVVDDGVGFDAIVGIRAGRLGLTSMRERAAEVGASLTVRSAPGQGTTVEVLWP
jgi:signal transduction histidine kinase